MSSGWTRGPSLRCTAELRRPVLPALRRPHPPTGGKGSSTNGARPGEAEPSGSRAVRYRRPDDHGLKTATQEDATVKRLISRVAQLEKYLKAGPISHATALKMLDAVQDVLEHIDIVSDGHLIFLVHMIGMICLGSPLTPVDPSFRPFLDTLTNSLPSRVSYLTTSDLCLVVWMYGCFGPSVLLPTMYTGVRPLISQMCMRLEGEVLTVQDTISLFTGLQKMKFSPHHDITYHTLKILQPTLRSQDFTVSQLARLVLLSSKLQVRDGVNLLRTAGRIVRNRLGEMTDQAMLDFVHGFVIYDKCFMPSLFDQFTAELSKRIESMLISDLIEITLSLSKIRYRPNEEFLKSFSQRVQSCVTTLKPKDVAACTHAMGQLDFYDTEILASLQERFIATSDTFNTLEICHTLIGFTRLDALTEELLSVGLCAVTRQLPCGMEKPQQILLHQVLTHAKLFLKMESIPSELFPVEWQSACLKEWIVDQKRPIYETEAAVLKTAQLLNLKPRQEKTPIGAISVHVFSSPNGKAHIVFDLVVEGKDCFMNDQQKMLPWKEWQYRVIAAEGFEVFPLRESKWRQVPYVSTMRHLATRLDLWNLEEIIEMEEAVGIRKREEDVDA